MLVTHASAHSPTRTRAVGADTVAIPSSRAATLTLLVVGTQAGRWPSLDPAADSLRLPFLQSDLRRSPSAGTLPPGAPATRSQQHAISSGGRDNACRLAEPPPQPGQEQHAGARCTVSQTIVIAAEAHSSQGRRQRAEGLPQPLSAAAVTGDGKPKQSLEPGKRTPSL